MDFVAKAIAPDDLGHCGSFESRAAGIGADGKTIGEMVDAVVVGEAGLHCAEMVLEEIVRIGKFPLA